MKRIIKYKMMFIKSFSLFFPLVFVCFFSYGQTGYSRVVDGILHLPVLPSDPASPEGDGAIYLNSTDNTVHYCDGYVWQIPGPPMASAVTQTGSIGEGETLTGTYAYSDAEGDPEGTSTYQWYRSASSDGSSPTAIAGATGQTYILDAADVDQYVGFAVTPVAQTGISPGSEVVASTFAGPVIEVIVSSSGRTWMGRNLGASQKADSITDYNAYGSLFQWCRAADGHELITWDSSTSGTPDSGTTSTQANDATNVGHTNFITDDDWVSSSLSNGNLWWSGSTIGANNPCPAGFHVPHLGEWQVEQQIIEDNGNNSQAAFDHLALPVPGIRHTDGTLSSYVGSAGRYWSCATSGGWAFCLYISGSNTRFYTDPRASGFSVRCIKDL